MEDQEVILEESPQEEVVEDPVEDPVAAEPEPEEDERPQLSAREQAYQYLRDNPDELASLAGVAARMQQQPSQSQELKEPDPDDFSTYEEYMRADRAYNKAMLAQMEQRIRSEYAPVVSTQIAASVTDELARKYAVPDEGREYISKQLQGVPPQAIASLDDTAKELLAYAAKGYASTKTQGRSNGKHIPVAEPVAGVGPVKVQLADGVTQGEMNAYLELTGKKLTRETIADLRKEGYLK